MAAGQDSEAIIATLEEAKVKLGEAQRHAFAGLTRLAKIRSAIEFTLGRLGRGNPAITLLRDAEKSIKDRAVEINGLSARVDKAIAEIREAAGGGSSAPSPDPAPSDTVPVSRPHTHSVVAGNAPVLVHNTNTNTNTNGGGATGAWADKAFFDSTTMKKKYSSHAGDWLDSPGPENRASLVAFEDALRGHMTGLNTKIYRFNYRGQGQAVGFIDPNSMKMVMLRADSGKFWSAFKIGDNQFSRIVDEGRMF